jgi:hypothetical protein
LLLFQAANCNHQVPAKLYEYLRCRRPILALTDDAGDTAATLRRLQTGRIVDISNQHEIEIALQEFLWELRSSAGPVLADARAIQDFSRENLARVYAAVLDSLVAA